VNETETENPLGFRGRLQQAYKDSDEPSSKRASFSVPPAWGASSLLGKIWDLTNTARLDGAASLKQHILAQDDNQKQFIIAHSHGGNVAMYALQDPEVRQRVAGLICMATPFLYPRERPLNLSYLILSWLIMTVGIWQFLDQANLLNGGWMASSSAWLLMLLGIVVPALLILVVTRQRYGQKTKGSSSLADHLDKLSYVDPNIPILLIRASGDEASGLLRGTQFLNWLGGRVMRLAGRQIFGIICAAALVLLWMAYRQFNWLPDNTFTVFSATLIGLSAITMMMLIALIGLDAWPWVGELETMIEDGPPGIKSELVVITPRQPVKGLSHTEVYSQQETIDTISTWCEQC